jgi:hypothetical protein
MQYLHRLMAFIDVDFLVYQDSNFPWTKWGMQGGWLFGHILGPMVPCSTFGKAP